MLRPPPPPPLVGALALLPHHYVRFVSTCAIRHISPYLPISPHISPYLRLHVRHSPVMGSQGGGRGGQGEIWVSTPHPGLERRGDVGCQSLETSRAAQSLPRECCHRCAITFVSSMLVVPRSVWALATLPCAAAASVLRRSRLGIADSEDGDHAARGRRSGRRSLVLQLALERRRTPLYSAVFTVFVAGVLTVCSALHNPVFPP